MHARKRLSVPRRSPGDDGYLYVYTSRRDHGFRPRPRVVRLVGARMTLAGVASFCMEPLRAVGIVFLVLSLLHAIVADLLLNLSREADAVRRQSDGALQVVRQMEHADPAEYDDRPSGTSRVATER